MRAVFSVLGLLLVVVLVSLLVKKKIEPLAATPQRPASAQQQIKQALDAAMQTPRDVPEDKP